MLEGGFAHDDGTIRAPDGPGLGIDISAEVLESAE
jgi:L-alanine-DL-glutamate epimerase-like enolase superfamily enzyme